MEQGTAPIAAKRNNSNTEHNATMAYANGADNHSTGHYRPCTPWPSPPTTQKRLQTAATYLENSSLCTAPATRAKAPTSSPRSEQPPDGVGGGPPPPRSQVPGRAWRVSPRNFSTVYLICTRLEYLKCLASLRRAALRPLMSVICALVRSLARRVRERTLWRNARSAMRPVSLVSRWRVWRLLRRIRAWRIFGGSVRCCGRRFSGRFRMTRRV